MGTEAAVSIAEITLGYLEMKNNYNPLTWARYIDDGLCVVPRNENQDYSNNFLDKLNALDQKINWTTEPIEDAFQRCRTVE